MTEEETKIAKEKYGINEKQLAFCELYIELDNAQKSYMIAYENENMNTSGVNGSKLLKKDNIAKYLAERKQNMLKNNRIGNKEEVLAFWTKTMFDPNTSINARLDASKLLGKNLGLLNENVNINHAHDFEINLLGMDKVEQISSNIINQQNKLIEQEEYQEADYEEVEESAE